MAADFTRIPGFAKTEEGRVPVAAGGVVLPQNAPAYAFSAGWPPRWA